MPLSYKTRGMSNPTGKPRVFFCCHPDDFDSFFENISEEILKKQNCAIWYDKEHLPLDEERIIDLSEMQLFVMPVTTRLLTKPNTAMDEYFPFAMERHIPVLPLMQESRLEKLFNEKFGDLQFLDKNANDATAISFDEKLEKYLSSVLVGDELAKKVRAAFDAYIFLSYRKKDRKYANELMKLIHNNDICRDIAIWYDEYLVPGENFNDAIAAALAKSDFFTLAVTPNLINEVNYVMTVEYPEVKKTDKPILPAEVVPTDKDELKEKYEGIPEIVDAHDNNALNEALLNAIKKIAIEENDKDPQHNFFIGLAYLNGIDVEVNHERALSLITGAAEADLPEAFEKLVDMYKNGIGVEKDYFAAIKWQEKYVDLLKNIYNESCSVDDAGKYVIQTLSLGEMWETLIEYPEALEIYKSVEVFLSGINEDDDFRTLQHYMSMCLTELGNVCNKIELEIEAAEYYDKAMDIDMELFLNSQSPVAMYSYLQKTVLLGNSFFDMGYFDEAEDTYNNLNIYFRDTKAH